MNSPLSIACLPLDVRSEADLWHRSFLSLGAKGITHNLHSLAKQFGVSFPTARRKYSAWKNSGQDRLALVNRSKLPCASDLRPLSSDLFRDWYQALCERHQRKSKPAYREFCRRWAAGEEIPGLDNSLPRHTLPAGCSYENLQRLLKDKFSLAVMRRGLGFAIAHHGPKIFTTRAGMPVGAFYMFDDLWHDHFVVFKGQIVRVLEFDALDVASGCKCAWGTKPRIRREDGTMEGLPEKFMRMLLANLLFNEGFNPDGCTLLAEHGTAAIRDNVEALLHDRTHGAITVQRSGITGEQQAILGGGTGQGKGNPRFKAPLESLRNLMHNELAALPGQTGLDRDTRPEQTHGILCETEDLLKAVAALAKTRPQVADLIKLPLLQYHAHFLPLLSAIYDRMNRRTWHNLEGWTACGHIAIEYRLSPDSQDWLSQSQFLALPQQTQSLLMSAISSPSVSSVPSVVNNSLLRERALSPWEVWSSAKPTLQRIPSYVVAEILGDDFAQERKCQNGYFEFHDQELSPEVLRYDARLENQEPGTKNQELVSDTYKVFVNPFDLRQLFVHDARGRFLGIAPRSSRVTRGDTEATADAFHYRSKRLADLLHPVKVRHQDITQEATARATHNADVLAPDRAPKLSKEDRQTGEDAGTDILGAPAPSRAIGGAPAPSRASQDLTDADDFGTPAPSRAQTSDLCPLPSETDDFLSSLSQP
jgi:hypothetical protein